MDNRKIKRARKQGFRRWKRILHLLEELLEGTSVQGSKELKIPSFVICEIALNCKECKWIEICDSNRAYWHRIHDKLIDVTNVTEDYVDKIRRQIWKDEGF